MEKAFVIDRHTFADLEILETKSSKDTIFKFFDRAISHGGREVLLDMFHCPLSDIREIRERQAVIRYVCEEKIPVSINKYLLEFIELYLQQCNKPVKVSRLDALNKAFNYMIKPTTEYYIIQRGVKEVIEFLQELYALSADKSLPNIPHLWQQQLDFLDETIRFSELRHIIGFNTKKRIGIIEREKFDHIFRYCESDRLKKIIRIVYQIDAFQAVAKTREDNGLVFPEIVESKKVDITGLYHLFVKNAVANNVCLHDEKNILFVTGANMAGKSTFLKAFGVAVFLAHLGFPVPAVSMQTGVFNGLFSTINLADNLNKGYSHFYTEVLRVKNVAEEINRTKNIVVIFDELFRGTNVKDAYDASLAIISAFAKVKGSMFLVSTHIMEVAEQLNKLKNIHFGYFHTDIKGKEFTYSYRLLDGVTEERLGMLIIENERIIETINNNN